MCDGHEKNRFGFVGPDVCLEESQCVKCKNNSGKTCEVFGVNPEIYLRAVLKEKCPFHELVKR